MLVNSVRTKIMFSIFKEISQLDSRILKIMEERAKIPQPFRSSDHSLSGELSYYDQNGERLKLLVKERGHLKERVGLYIELAAIASALVNGILALVITLLN